MFRKYPLHRLKMLFLAGSCGGLKGQNPILGCTSWYVKYSDRDDLEITLCMRTERYHLLANGP